MNNVIKFSLIITLLTSTSVYANCPDYLNVDLPTLRSGKTMNICEAFPNQPLLIVNTASHCGFTPQFKGLEALHKKYADKGLVVLGFPSNTFFQEADSAEETANVCYVNYGVSFQMFAEVEVRGDDAHPVFKELSKQAGAPNWNFNKYLVDRNGQVIEHFGSRIRPESAELQKQIENALIMSQ